MVSFLFFFNDASISPNTDKCYTCSFFHACLSPKDFVNKMIDVHFDKFTVSYQSSVALCQYYIINCGEIQTVVSCFFEHGRMQTTKCKILQLNYYAN